MYSKLHLVTLLITLFLLPPPLRAQRGQFDKTPVNPADEQLIFTPLGHEQAGQVVSPPLQKSGRLAVTIVDSATGQPTFCRVNVVGPDGNYYQPRDNPLARFSMTGNWPDAGQGNRPGKGPIRYFGHFFYCRGKFTVDLPEGSARIEVWKGFEYTPRQTSTEIRAGQLSSVEVSLTRSLDTAALGYWSGDPHLHFPRGGDAEDELIFDLLAAEDIRYGVVMCYNETNAYSGAMSQLVMPQLRGLGKRSIARRGAQHIISGQEYRNNVYGHLNLFLRDDLVAPGTSYDPNQWPVFGIVGRETREQGGVAIHAHGGYAQEIYADLVQRATAGVELLQFGIYRGIGLEAWYRVLNCGFRFPAVGASDYPACRKLGDCQTYVYCDHEPAFEEWLAGLAAGQSFVTTGPVLLLEVDGEKPGSVSQLRGTGPHRLKARLRARCEVTPITHLQLIVGGRIVRQSDVPRADGTARWLELSETLEVDSSTWIAARAFSASPTGSPDAESHTNPVYVYVDDRAPYDEESLTWLARELDAQIEEQSKRQFVDRSRVVEYYRRSRDILDDIRIHQGQPAPRTIE